MSEPSQPLTAAEDLRPPHNLVMSPPRQAGKLTTLLLLCRSAGTSALLPGHSGTPSDSHIAKLPFRVTHIITQMTLIAAKH